MGMCSGVRRALRITERIPSPNEVTIVGELVHNTQVHESLKQRGFQFCSNRKETPSTTSVMIPAHGVSRRYCEKLKTANKTLIDATCPFVRHIHDTVKALKNEDRFIIMIGKPGHAEVEGIVEDLEQCAVTAAPEDVQAYPYVKLGVVCQSTVSPLLSEQVFRRIQQLNPKQDIRFVQTICPATRERQNAVRSLMGRVNALVVVGGAHSNNTLELVQLVVSHGLPCLHIQTADDINPEWFYKCRIVGLTAGASTPDWVIDAVEETLYQLSPDAYIIANHITA